MTTSAVDVVVIGAGLGGLSAAAQLGRRGRSVVVLEHGEQPGGYAVGFERPPFRFDASLHQMEGFALRGSDHAVLNRLGIADRVVLNRVDPLYMVRSSDGDVVVPASTYAYEELLEELFPDEQAGIRAWLDDCRAAVADSARFQRDVHMKRFAPQTMAADYPVMTRLLAQTWKEVTDSHVSDPRLASLLTVLWTYGATPPSRLAGVVGMSLAGRYGIAGGWYPVGGAATIPRLLVEDITKAGGRIEYGQTVTAIDTADGRATSVSTQSGLTVDCRCVVSNAAAPQLPGLLGPDVLPEDFVARLTGPRETMASVSVFLGLDRDVFGESGLPHEVFLVEEYDSDVAYEAFRAGDWRRAGLAVTDYTSLDPGCAPPGGGVVSITALADSDFADTWGSGVGEKDPDDVKESVAAHIVAIADAAIPGLASAAVHREVATPLTNQRYTLNPGGSIAGFEPTNEVLVGSLGNTTPVPNLFQAGAWTGAGGEVGALESGNRAAGQAERHLAAT